MDKTFQCDMDGWMKYFIVLWMIDDEILQCAKYGFLFLKLVF